MFIAYLHGQQLKKIQQKKANRKDVRKSKKQRYFVD